MGLNIALQPSARHWWAYEQDPRILSGIVDSFCIVYTLYPLFLEYETMKTYYIVKTGADRYDLRQSRYAEQFKAGKEHPHDLMATGFCGADMRDLLEKHFKYTDDSTLE